MRLGESRWNRVGLVSSLPQLKKKKKKSSRSSQKSSALVRKSSTTKNTQKEWT